MYKNFSTRVNGETSEFHPIKSGDPHCSVLRSIQYLMYIIQLPITDYILTGTFADHMALLAIHENSIVGTF